jgi:hypothetical protein
MHLDLLVATIVELDGVGVSARFENDVIFLGQSFVHAGRQNVEVAKWPRRSLRAVWKQRLEFLFRLQ